MSDYLIKEETLNNLANSVRTLSGSDASMTPDEMIATVNETKGAMDALEEHKNDKANPHNVTAAQIGAVKYETMTKEEYLALETKDPNTLYLITDDSSSSGELENHINNKSNPHEVTASQVGAPTIAEMNSAIAAIPTPDVSGQINTHNESSESHMDIRTIANEAKIAAEEAQALVGLENPTIKYGTETVSSGATSAFPEGTLYVVIES